MKRPIFDIQEGSVCPHCEVGTICRRAGRYGEFYACSMYPGCAFTQQIAAEVKSNDPAGDFLKQHGINMPLI